MSEFSANVPHLTLYFREYCSLCHQMRDALTPWLERGALCLDIVDVDADPVLEARFNERVPVLMAGEREICYWHLDVARLNDFLAETR